MHNDSTNNKIDNTLHTETYKIVTHYINDDKDDKDDIQTKYSDNAEESYRDYMCVAELLSLVRFESLSSSVKKIELFKHIEGSLGSIGNYRLICSEALVVEVIEPVEKNQNLIIKEEKLTQDDGMRDGGWRKYKLITHYGHFENGHVEETFYDDLFSAEYDFGQCDEFCAKVELFEFVKFEKIQDEYMSIKCVKNEDNKIR